MRSRIHKASENTQLVRQVCFFFFSQVRRPIESKFTQVCYFMHKWEDCCLTMNFQRCPVLLSGKIFRESHQVWKWTYMQGNVGEECTILVIIFIVVKFGCWCHYPLECVLEWIILFLIIKLVKVGGILRNNFSLRLNSFASRYSYGYVLTFVVNN